MNCEIFNKKETSVKIAKVITHSLTEEDCAIRNCEHHWRNLKNALLFVFHFACLEYSSDPCVWIPSECPPLLAGLDQNAQGNAGAQPNPPPKLLCGLDNPHCGFNCHTGNVTGILIK